MSIREGRWLCNRCGSENLGRFEECNGLDRQSGCGGPRKKGVKFYLPENSPVVTDPDLLADANSGQDWICDHCDGANKNAYNGRRAISCVHCGQGRDKKDFVHPKTFYSLGAVPTSGREEKFTQASVRSFASSSSTFAPKAFSRPKEKGDTGPKLLIGSFAMLVVFAVWYFFFATFQINARVDNLSWERAVSIEAYRTVTEEDWDIPSSGKEVTSERKVRRYEQVFDHYENRARQLSKQVATGSESYKCGTEDMGNGYFRDVECSRTTYETQYYNEDYQESVYRDEPIYATWYTYEIDKWVFARKPTAQGRDRNPIWPIYNLADNERVAAKNEKYSVNLAGENKSDYSINLPQSVWQEVSPSRMFVLTVNRVGSVLEFK